MIFDAQNLFSDEQAVTATAASTNLIDFGEPRDMGTGKPIYFVVIVDVAFTDSGSDSTIAVTLETDDNAGFSSATTGQTIGTFAALAAIGARFVAVLQPEVIDERFLRVKYTAANGNLTTGSFTAFLTVNPHLFSVYPDNITIS